MQQLPTRLPFELMQTRWASVLNPVLGIPLLDGNQILNVTLTANKARPINHLLQRMPVGWFITDIDANAVVWRTQDFTKNTITLESNANVTINFWVY